MKPFFPALFALAILSACGNRGAQAPSGKPQADSGQLPVIVPDTSAVSMPVVPTDTAGSNMPVVTPPDSIRPK